MDGWWCHQSCLCNDTSIKMQRGRGRELATWTSLESDEPREGMGALHPFLRALLCVSLHLDPAGGGIELENTSWCPLLKDCF